MRTVLAHICAGLLLSASTAIAQCPTPAQLTQCYQQILQKPVIEQHQPLLAWLQQWERCKVEADSIYVGALLQTGQGYYLQNELPEAARLVEKAIQVCYKHRRTTRPCDLSKAFYRLGVVYTRQNKIQAAMDALKRAVAIGASDRQASNWVGNAHLYLAYAYMTSGDCQNALSHAEAGIPLAVQLSNKPLAANLFRQKAQALYTLEHHNEAQASITRAINYIKNEVSLEQALADDYSLLSLILGAKQQYQEALYYAKLSYKIAYKTNYYQIPSIANDLAFLYNKTGDYKNAIRYSQYGIDKATDAFGKATGYDILGTVFWGLKQYSRALGYYQRGIRALPIEFKGQTVEANPTEKQIRLVAHKGILLTLLQDKADTWLDYAKSLQNSQKNLHYALDTYRVADEMIDYMRWEHTGQQSKLFWREKTRGMYEQAVETCWRLGDAEQAFRFIEKSRAVMLADKVNELGARQQLTPSQVKKESRLRQSVSGLQEQLTYSSPGKAYDSLRAALFVRQDSLDAFLKQLEVTNTAYYRYKYDNGTPSLADLRAYLAGRKATFVSYFLGDSALYVLAVSAGRDTLIREPVGQYTQAVRAFMGLLADPDAMNQRANFERFLKLGNVLYKQLLAPLKLSTDRIIVSPDGAFVPFGALSRSAISPDYLLKTNAFSYAYSARLLLKKWVHKSHMFIVRQQTFLGVAPVSFAPKLGQVSLPGSDDALRAIAEHFGSSTLLTHNQATRGAFLNRAINTQVVHLFTHAIADDSTGQEPTLYFADTTLQLSELGDAGLFNTQMVVLAACKTGVGANQRGEGVFSLARGFAAMGAPSVLTTLWSVENRATYDITKLFYQYLAEGLPKDEALQRAQRDWFEKAEGANKLPNYWAGLIIVGDTEPLQTPARWPWVVGSLVLLAAGAGIWWWRRRDQVKRVVSLRQPV